MAVHTNLDYPSARCMLPPQESRLSQYLFTQKIDTAVLFIIVLQNRRIIGYVLKSHASV